MSDRDRGAHGPAARGRLDHTADDQGGPGNDKRSGETKGAARDHDRQPASPPVDEGGGGPPHGGDPPSQTPNPPNAAEVELARLTRALVFWTRVLAGCAVVASVIAFSQWKEMTRQADLMNDQLTLLRSSESDTLASISVARSMAAAAQGSLALAKSDAFVAKGQLNTAQDTEKRQLRGYVYVSVDSASPIVADTTPTAKVHVGVLGQTPVYDMRPAFFIDVGSYNTGPDFFNRRIQKGAEITPTDLHPPQFFDQTITGEHAITSANVENIMKNASRLYVWGRIDYKDTFGLPHHTHFCMRYGGRFSNGDAIGGNLCRAGNDDN